MLIVKVFINQNQIDEIHIHNVGGDEINGLYRIEYPVGFENIMIKHKRINGYGPLLQKALRIINHGK